MEKLKLKDILPDDAVRWTPGPNLVTYITIATVSSAGKDRYVPKCYWRLADPGGRDLFSIDVEEKTGRVIMMELTAYSGMLHPQHEISNEAIKVDRGVPTFDVSLWTSLIQQNKWPMVYDVPKKFLLQLGQEELRIELFSEQIKHHVVVGDKLVFEFNEKEELCAVTLKEFDAESQSHIKKEFDRRERQKTAG